MASREVPRTGPAVVPILDPTPEAPVRLGRYDLIARVADGGMGAIFMATIGNEGGHQGLVAIKRMQPHLTGNRTFTARFENEARILSSTRHPNLVRVFETGEDRWGIPYMVMEFLPGATFKGVIRAGLANGAMPPIPFSVWVAAQTARALHHVHTVGLDGEPVIHRDVSPENIVITFSGEVKLLDFGAAAVPWSRGHEAMDRRTESGEILLGKLSYLAPERAHGEPAIPASDQFSVGVLLHEAITGRRAFVGFETIESLRRAMERPMPRAREINPEVPEALDEIVARACCLTPRDRFPDCGAFADALEGFLLESGLLVEEHHIALHMQELFAKEFQAMMTWPWRPLPALPEGDPSLPEARFTSTKPPNERGRDRPAAEVLRGMAGHLLLVAALGAMLAVALVAVERLGNEPTVGRAALPGAESIRALEHPEPDPDAEGQPQQAEADQGHSGQEAVGHGAVAPGSQGLLEGQPQEAGDPQSGQDAGGDLLEPPARELPGDGQGHQGEGQVHERGPEEVQ